MNISDFYKIFKKFPEIITDSRETREGTIFIALKGANFNGNKFAIQALKDGCEYAIVDEILDSEEYVSRLILVEDSLEFLQDLSRFHRRQFNIPVIGITGTNGKTSTKELVHSVLSKKFNTLSTIGNFNNHIGVPLTLLRITEQHQIAIIEMGANHVGEILDLCQIAEPNYGLVTNVGEAHLEGFGSFENIIKTKIDLYKSVYQNKGTNFSLLENKEIREALSDEIRFIEYSCKESSCQTFGYGKVDDSFIELNLKNLESSDIEPITIKTRMIGLYNESNILAAITIGNYFEVPLKDIKAGLEDYTPNNNRSQLIDTSKNRIILDAYNANPTSVTVAIENINSIQHPNKIIILGDMLELGIHSKIKHQAIVEQLSDIPETKTILIGEEFGKTMITNDIKRYPSTQNFVDSNDINSIEDALILIKGSRGMKLEQLVKLL